jgi:4'-phosphopantetheinyl transferase
VRRSLLCLPDYGVHLWFAFPDEWKDSTLIASARHLLEDHEIARMKRFRFPEHRHLYLASHLLLRMTLSRYSDLPPNVWRFIESDHGKPRLDPDKESIPLYFSLSHTKGLAVVGVTREGEIGVDAEQTGRSVNAAELSRRFFSREEAAALGKLPPGRLKEQFFLYWTLKEAYIKTLGRGLSHPLDSFSFRLTGERPHRIGFSSEEPQDTQKWRFALIAPRPQSVTAVCMASARDRAIELNCYLMLPSGETELLKGELLAMSSSIVYERGTMPSAEGG